MHAQDSRTAIRCSQRGGDWQKYWRRCCRHRQPKRNGMGLTWSLAGPDDHDEGDEAERKAAGDDVGARRKCQFRRFWRAFRGAWLDSISLECSVISAQQLAPLFRRASLLLDVLGVGSLCKFESNTKYHTLMHTLTLTLSRTLFPSFRAHASDRASQFCLLFWTPTPRSGKSTELTPYANSPNLPAIPALVHSTRWVVCGMVEIGDAAVASAAAMTGGGWPSDWPCTSSTT